MSMSAQEAEKLLNQKLTDMQELEKYNSCQKSEITEANITREMASTGALVGGVTGRIAAGAAKAIPYVGKMLPPETTGGLVISGSLVGAAVGKKIADCSIEQHHKECEKKLAKEAEQAKPILFQKNMEETQTQPIAPAPVSQAAPAAATAQRPVQVHASTNGKTFRIGFSKRF